MSTNFMNIDLPVVSSTLGPEWASMLNEALEVVDAHDHSSGKGTKVKVSGLDINDDLDFQENTAYGLTSIEFEPVSVALSGADNANGLSVFAGDLYYVNGSGVSVQITDGGSVITTPGTFSSFEITSISGNLSIGAGDTFVFIRVDTSAARTITLPLASAVVAGRVYVIKDVTGDANANPITIEVSGSDTIDGESEVVFDSQWGSIWFIGNGATAWNIG